MTQLPAHRSNDEVSNAAGRIHLVGICGTGMAGLATMLKDLGYPVSGSDENIYPPMSTMLERAGVPVSSFDLSNLGGALECVVLGAGVSRRNIEALAAVERGLPFLSFPAALERYVIQGRETHIVAGTHGKTTTTSMLAWIHETSGTDPGFFIGGMPTNFGQSARLPGPGVMIIEGDEYKSSNFDHEPKFLKYTPRIAVVTNVEFDHADVFPDYRAVIDAFVALARAVEPDGVLVTSAGIEVADELKRAARCRVVRVARDAFADWKVIARRGNGVSFVEVHPLDASDRAIGPFELTIPGDHNIDNAALAAVAARFSAVKDEPILRAMRTFTGVKRRLELVASGGGTRLFDDFAHHPSAVLASIRALKRDDPGRQVWAIFEPRSATSRQSVFQDRYAEVLSEADRVTVTTVAPTLTTEVQPLDAHRLARDITARGTPAVAWEDVASIVSDVERNLAPGMDIVVMSIGPFGRLVEKLRALIAARPDQR